MAIVNGINTETVHGILKSAQNNPSDPSSAELVRFWTAVGIGAGIPVGDLVALTDSTDKKE